MDDPVHAEITSEVDKPVNGPQYLRITTQGKMQDFVSFSLQFLERDEANPLVLHTLPVDLAGQLQRSTKETADNSATKGTLSEASQVKPSAMTRVTDTIPRLVSVVEIIKREYLKTPQALSCKRLTGLYQYNNIGCLEDLQSDDPASLPSSPQEDRATLILQALEGMNHLKLKQTPYMQITLSKYPLLDRKDNHTTYQAPSVRKISKSAKHRAKKREKKLAAANAAEGTEIGPGERDDMEDDESDR